MSSVTELKDALKSSLDRNGSLRELQAQLRAAIFKSLSDADPVPSSKPGPSDENLVCNELIREYLAWNGYRETLSVFLPGELDAVSCGTIPGCVLAVMAAESGQPLVKPFTRSFMAEHLGIAAVEGANNSRQVPLLNVLVASAQAQAQAQTHTPSQ
ncbi:hypothetical protein QJQ45_024510 [Haematococcus lacustris]|nr:hypothetical protein QJQ45_024510 [Haematococcus lacustris]